MRQGQQHRRGRGRNNNNNQNNGHHRKGQNPLTRSFESNGPDVKVRGTPSHIAEKYIQLARDAQSSGDHVLAENYLQHAEHYNRIILAYREQQIQQSGEMQNGAVRQFNPRMDNPEGDEAGSEELAAGQEDPMAGEQPSFDDGRQHRNGEHHHRQRDRHHRHERHERHDRGFDRQRERPQYSQRGDEQPMTDMGEPRRMQRDAAEANDREPMADEPNRAVSEEGASPTPRAERAPRGDGGPRRRERYGMGQDQPDFLRRPVRRSRREQPDADFTPEASSSPGEETPRE